MCFFQLCSSFRTLLTVSPLYTFVNFLTNLSQSLISFPLIRGLESPEAGVFKPPPRSIFRSPQVVAKSPLFFLVLLVFVTGT